MQTPPDINDPLENPIVGFDSIMLDYPEHDTVVDLSSIEIADNKKLHSEWNRLKREGLPMSLIMCDVD